MPQLQHIIANPEQVWEAKDEIAHESIDYGLLAEDPMAMNKTKFQGYLRAKCRSIYLIETKRGVSHDDAVDITALAATDLIDRWKAAAKAKANRVRIAAEANG